MSSLHGKQTPRIKFESLANTPEFADVRRRVQRPRLLSSDKVDQDARLKARTLPHWNLSRPGLQSSPRLENPRVLTPALSLRAGNADENGESVRACGDGSTELAK